jgi:hypothetical protein
MTMAYRIKTWCRHGDRVEFQPTRSPNLTKGLQRIKMV